jgi:serine/threonine protein kinase/WD40 repeat protein
LTRIGPYEVLGNLGRGGAGVVLRARAPDGRQVAVKVLLRPDAAASAERFERERRLQAALGEAEGFVPLLDAGVDAGRPYLVMPLVVGGTLRERLTDRPWSPKATRELGRTLAAALGRAHAQGVVHRDMKPENVLFTDDGEPLITDLGLAKHFRSDAPGASQSVSISRSGVLMGSAGYMSPEHLEDPRRVGPASDVFALGAILYECLTCAPAFAATSMLELIARLAAGNYQPLSQARPGLPPDLEAIIDRALSLDLSDRYADGAAFAAALAAPAPPPPSRRPGWKAVGIGAALALVVGAVAFVTRGPPSRSEVEGPLEEPVEESLASSEGPVPPPVLPDPPDPRPDATPPPATQRGPLPPQTDSFREGLHLRLKAVWGDYSLRHADRVHVVRHSADGSRVVAVSEDRLLRVWSVPEGEELLSIEVGRDAPSGTSLAVGPDGMAYVGFPDGTVGSWDVRSGIPGPVRRGHDDLIPHLRIDASGGVLYSGSLDGTVGVWALDRPGEVQSALEVGAPVSGLAISDAGQLLVGTAQGTLALYDRTGQRLHRVPAHKSPVTAIVFLPGQRAMTGANDGEIALWDLRTMVSLHKSSEHTRMVMEIVPLPGGGALSASDDGAVIWWDTEPLAVRETLSPHARPATSLDLAPGGAGLVSSSDDGTLLLWTLDDGAPRPQELHGGGHRGRVGRIEVLDEEQVVTGGLDGTLRVWSLARDRLLRDLSGLEGDVTEVAVGPGGVFGGGDREGWLVTWNVQDLSRKFTALGDHRTHDIAWLDGQRMAVLEINRLRQSGRLRLIHLGDGDDEQLPHDGVTRIASAGDGRLVVGGADGSVTLRQGWEEEGRLIHTHPSVVSALLASGRRVLSADVDGRVHSMQVIEGIGITHDYLEGSHETMVDGLALHPGDRLAASCDQMGRVVLWDLLVGRELERLDLGPSGDIAIAIAFSAWRPSRSGASAS